jgi:ribose 5-phosphate isomerase RpiB
MKIAIASDHAAVDLKADAGRNGCAMKGMRSNDLGPA